MMVPLVLVVDVIILSIIGYFIRLLYRKYFPKSETDNNEESSSIQNEEEEISLLSDFNENEEEEIENNSATETSSREFPINASTLKASLFIAYSSYITVTGAVLTVLQPCVNGYFRDIPWISCSWDNSTYSSLIISGIFFLILYVLGIPAGFAALLYRYRKQLHAETPIAKAVEFLYEEFRPGMYYYELIWMARRLLLVMGIMLIPPESGWQFAFCSSVMAFSLFLQSICKPFVHRYDNFTEILASLSVFVLYGVSVVDVIEYNNNLVSNLFAIYFFIILLWLFFLTFSPILLVRFQWYRNLRNTSTANENDPVESNELVDLGSDGQTVESQGLDVVVNASQE